ncbi:hypothetical protein NP493_527g05011 [Ridgeia piscesae]|uniref:Carboxylic ester hydrolase n=1 Tax=Ridgeia piscesae TaxID=27915 RepID=A0AAD9KWZ0_RIDPI|nr:hypothetical protein NP493_527g05011 [Ridgeia piscesae]
MELTLLCVVLACVHARATRYLEVSTRSGKLRGFRETVEGRDVDVFLGVPYARPPVGPLRFRRPQMTSPWSTTLDATRHPPACYQQVDESFERFQGVEMWNPNTNMSEDCLYLNIWAPADKGPSAGGETKARTVMVWIYGGSFSSGSANLDVYDGRILAATNDVVVVSMQYRMGALGFLYLDVPEAPGNMGLLDQLMALQWVYNNIRAFGGDSHAITLFGESSGAASVGLHLLSPLSRKLVRYAIMESSSALSPWAVDLPSVARARATSLADSLGCDARDVTPATAIFECIARHDARTISATMWTIPDRSHIPTPFVPTVDRYFLRDHPSNVLRKQRFKKTPVLMGVNEHEGSYFLVYIFPDVVTLNASRRISRAEFVRSLPTLVPQSRADDVTAASVSFEYGVPYRHGGATVDYRDVMEGLLGDVAFICPVVDFADAFADAGLPVYVYRFTHRTSQNAWPAWMGAMHGYEIDHVFGCPLNVSLNYTRAEAELSRRLMTYWTNFAKFG